jgi:predicted PurR-regulated permease PerM
MTPSRPAQGAAAGREPSRNDPTPPLLDAQPRGPERRSETSGLMGLAVGVVTLVALRVASDVLVPIVLAILLSFVLVPVVRLLRRTRMGRVPAVVLAVLLSLAVILSMGGLIGAQVSDLLTDLPRYAATMDAKISRARGALTGQIAETLGGFGQRLEQASGNTAPTPPNGAGTSTVAPGSTPPPQVVLRQPTPTMIDIAQRVLAPIMTPLMTTVIVLVVAIFMLLQQVDLRDRMIRLLGMTDRYRTTRALDDAASRLSRYLLALLCLNTAFGIVIGVGLLLIGVPNPLLFGTLAALFRFIPYLGSIISASLPVLLASSIDPGWGPAIWTALLFLIGETVMGQLIDPLVAGRSTGLSPLSVVIAAIFWAWMWGPIGLILSTPLTVCLVVLGRHVQPLEFLDVLMGDHPALTPAESFYQRILSHDPDEALDQVESMLKDCSLSTYYDTVAIKGLQMVSEDAERGVLSDQQLLRIRQAMARLLADLDSHADGTPGSKPEASDAPELEVGVTSRTGTTLCVPGGGPLDELASDMLWQLLGKNGMPARRAASWEAMTPLEGADIGLVSIASLQATGGRSRLRDLVRRIRARLPDAVILVMVISPDDAGPEDRFRNAVAADVFVTSLQQAVQSCRPVRRMDKEAVLF